MRKFVKHIRANVVTLVAAIIVMAVGASVVDVHSAQAATAGSFGAEQISAVVRDTRANVVSSLSNGEKYSSLLGTEWDMIALARDNSAENKDLFEKYYSDIVKLLNDKGRTEPLGSTPTEYERVILALTAMGYDASNVDGYNFFEYLSSYTNVMKQTINAAIFGLLAVSSNSKYDFSEVADSSDQTTESKLITYILDSEKADGGWALFGSVSDIDITGMTLQALAPYKGTSDDAGSRVTNAINRGVALLSERQTSNGGYLDFYKEENACSQAQVVTALGSLGLSFDDPRFVRGEHSTIENLMQFYLGNGTFMNKKSLGKADRMAQYQSYYALVAYQRALSGRNSLYNMNAESHDNANNTDDVNGTNEKNPSQPGAGSEGDSDSSGAENGTGTTTAGNGDSANHAAVNSDTKVNTSTTRRTVTPFGSIISSSVAKDSLPRAGGSEDKEAGQNQPKGTTHSTDDSEDWDFSADEYDAKKDGVVAGTLTASGVSQDIGMSTGTIVLIVIGASAVLGGTVGGVSMVRKNAKAGHSRA